MRSLNKKGFEMSFKWIFSVVVGIAVLFFAIYAATKLIGTANYQVSTETAAMLPVLISPLETSYDSANNRINFPVEVKLYNQCSSRGEFGKQIFSLQERSIGDSWTDQSSEISTNSKFVFSESMERGKTMYLTGIPFMFPFKVADIVIMHSKPYCFENLDSEFVMESNMENILSVENFNVKFSNCSENKDYIQVCSYGDCDVKITELDNRIGYVEKKNSKGEYQELYYIDELMYAAIFSDPATYECQITRLSRKIAVLSEVYENKVNLMAMNTNEVCSRDITTDLQILRIFTKDFNGNSKEFIEQLDYIAGDLISSNSDSICNLWSDVGGDL